MEEQMKMDGFEDSLETGMMNLLCKKCTKERNTEKIHNVFEGGGIAVKYYADVASLCKNLKKEVNALSDFMGDITRAEFVGQANVVNGAVEDLALACLKMSVKLDKIVYDLMGME